MFCTFATCDTFSHDLPFAADMHFVLRCSDVIYRKLNCLHTFLYMDMGSNNQVVREWRVYTLLMQLSFQIFNTVE